MELPLRQLARIGGSLVPFPCVGHADQAGRQLRKCCLIEGELTYAPEPLDPPAEGNALICCSAPKTAVGARPVVGAAAKSSRMAGGSGRPSGGYFANYVLTGQE